MCQLVQFQATFAEIPGVLETGTIRKIDRRYPFNDACQVIQKMMLFSLESKSISFSFSSGLLTMQTSSYLSMTMQSLTLDLRLKLFWISWRAERVRQVDHNIKSPFKFQILFLTGEDCSEQGWWDHCWGTSKDSG